MSYKTLIRPLMILIPFLVGYLFPQLHVLNDPPWNLTRWLLAGMIFLTCLQIQIREVRIRKEHWLLLGLNLIFGIVPFFLLKFFLPEHPELALAAFFVGISPTASAAPVVVSFLNGRIGFALTGFVITNIGISLALIGLFPVVTGNFTLDFLWRVSLTLLEIIVVPGILAVIVRRLWDNSRAFFRQHRMFSFSLWCLLLCIIAAVARQYFIEHPGASRRTLCPIALVSLILCILQFSLGACVGSRKLRREMSQILGQKNTSFTMYLALTFAGPLSAMGPICYILWHNAWNAFQMYLYDLRLARKRKQIR